MKYKNLGHGEMVLVDGANAVLIGDYRQSADYGINRDKISALDPDDIASLLMQLDGEPDLEELSDEECADILQDIILIHPELRYIVQSYRKMAIAKEPGEPDETGKDATDAKPEKKDGTLKKVGKGIWGLLGKAYWNMYYGPDNRDAKLKERKFLKEFVKKNYHKMKAAEKEIKDRAELVYYLEEGLESGEMDMEELKAFNKLSAKDPKWLKKMDLPDYDGDDENFYRKLKNRFKKDPGIMGFSIDEIGLPSDALKNDSNEELKIAVMKDLEKGRIKIKPDKVMVSDDPDNRWVHIEAEIGPLFKIADYYNLRSEDVVLNDIDKSQLKDPEEKTK